MSIDPHEEQASKLAAFNAILAPLERLAGDVLTGDGRERCFQAFMREPAAFEVLARRWATKRHAGYARSLGLLVKMARQELDAIADLLRGVELKAESVCALCEMPGGHHLAECEQAMAA